MSIQALNSFEPAWFTPDSEKKKKQPARFLVKGLDGKGQAEIATHIKTSGDDIELLPSGYGVLFKLGVSNWENIVDNNGEPVAFPRNANDAQGFLPFAVQAELARHLLLLSFASVDDKKK